MPSALGIGEGIVAAGVDNVETDLRLPVPHLLQDVAERHARGLEHFVFAGRDAGDIPRQEEVETADLDTVAGKEERRLIAGFDAIQEIAAIASRKFESRDVVRLR